MHFGNMPLDGGHLLFDEAQKEAYIKEEPQGEKFIKTFIGAKELLSNTPKYCLWLDNEKRMHAPENFRKDYPRAYEIIKKVQEFRLASSRKQTVERAITPYLFGEIRFFGSNPGGLLLIVPRVSSERRKYVPISVQDDIVIPGDTCLAIDKATLYQFGILTSQMHMAWMRTVAGRLKSDYRYSKDIVYNNFIWPEATDLQEAEITSLAQAILDARAEFPDASLADLYDPLTMPPSLAKAHKDLDRAVDKLYQPKPFVTDANRVSLLFEKYQSYERG